MIMCRELTEEEIEKMVVKHFQVFNHKHSKGKKQEPPMIAGDMEAMRNLIRELFEAAQVKQVQER